MVKLQSKKTQLKTQHNIIVTQRWRCGQLTPTCNLLSRLPPHVGAIPLATALAAIVGLVGCAFDPAQRLEAVRTELLPTPITRCCIGHLTADNESISTGASKVADVDPFFLPTRDSLHQPLAVVTPGERVGGVNPGIPKPILVVGILAWTASTFELAQFTYSHGNWS